MNTDQIETLKEKGLKLTPQRISILKMLGKGGHFTGEQIYNEIRKKHRGISISTVYNTLNAFDRTGIVNSFEADGMRWYEARIELHVNLYCMDQKRVTDLDVDLTGLLTDLKNKGINPDKISIIVYSRCDSKV